MPDTSFQVLRREQLEQKLGISRSAIYQYMKKGTFPKKIKLGARSVGWLVSDIEAWLEQKIAERGQ